MKNTVKYYNGELWSFENNNSNSILDIKLGGKYLAKLNKYNKPFNNSSSQKTDTNKSNLKDHKSKKSTVIIKITGHKNSSTALDKHIKYLTRNGELEIQNEKSESLDKKNSKEELKNWFINHEDNKNTRSKRIATSIVFSAPPNTKPEMLLESVREFSEKTFSGRRYLLVEHNHDKESKENKKTKHPHVHLVVESSSPTNKIALRTNISQIREWRKNFSTISKNHGLELTYDRKPKSKTMDHEKYHSIYHLIKKGIVPDKYKKQNEIAKSRLARNDIKPTFYEQKLINRSISEYQARQSEISDIEALLKHSKNSYKVKEYKNEIKYLRNLNATQRMPMTNSQVFLKYSIHNFNIKKQKSLINNKTKTERLNLTAPTVKHYIYANNLANNLNLNLPPTANLDVNVLSNFIKLNKDKPTQNYIKYINDIAKERNLSISNDVMQSHSACIKWLVDNKKTPTVNSIILATKISALHGVSLPEFNNSKDVSKFISKYNDKPTIKMISYANSFAKNEDEKNRIQTLNKSDLSNYISKNSENIRDHSSYDEQKINSENHDNTKINTFISKINESGVMLFQHDLKDEDTKKNLIKSYAKYEDDKIMQNIYNNINDISRSKTKGIERDI